MWKYLVALLVVLLSMGGLVSAQNECTDCYANIITQTDVQTIDNVRLGLENPGDNAKTSVAVGNEGLTAGIIVTKAPAVLNPAAGTLFVQAPFARIDQAMVQSVSNLGSLNMSNGEGAKGITWNKAIQAAWIANQGVKELENTTTGRVYVKEGSYVAQTTLQRINNVYDYATREEAKVLNVDNKLAMIVDDVNAVLNLTANANSASTDSQASNGTIINGVEVTIAGSDPNHL